MSAVVAFLIFISLFMLSGLFSSSEIALFSLSRGTVKKLQQKKSAAALAVFKLKARPHRLLITILIGNNIVNIYTAALATELTIEYYGSKGVGITTGIVTFLILLFGEIFPKAAAQTYAATIALVVAQPLLLLTYLLWPFVILLEGLSHLFVRMLPGKYKATLAIEDEIRSLLHIGLEDGSTERHEHEFIEQVFKFNDTPISEVMIPYHSAVLVNGEAEISQIAHFLAESEYSRFPVYSGSKDNVIGMIHVKDVFRANNSEKRRDPIQTLVRRAITVKTSDKLDDAFGVLRSRRGHSALVQNNAKEIVGFVTMEDILERLVGKIHDEFDLHKKTG